MQAIILMIHIIQNLKEMLKYSGKYGIKYDTNN